MISDFSTRELSSNRKELQLELTDSMNRFFSSTIPIIQCFDFTLLRLNKWVLYIVQDYNSTDITIPGLGERISFFLHDPYTREQQYQPPFKTGTLLDDSQVLDLITDYKFRFITQPVILTNFDVANVYPPPVELLPYAEQWIHKSLNEICKPITPDICLEQREVVYYISDRLSSIDFRKLLSFELKYPARVLIFYKLFGGRSIRDITPYWFIESTKIDTFNCILSGVCPIISEETQPSSSSVMERIEQKIKANVLSQVKILIDETVSIYESEGTIVQLKGPSFNCIKIPGSDRWIFFGADNPEELGQDYTRAPQLVEYIPESIIERNQFHYLPPDIDYPPPRNIIVYFNGKNDNVAKFLLEHGLSKGLVLSTDQLLNLIYLILVNFINESMRLAKSSASSFLSYEPTIPSLDAYMMPIVDSLVNNPLPITEQSCSFDLEEGQYLHIILGRFGKMTFIEHLQLPYLDLVRANTLTIVIDRLCRNEKYYTQFVIPLQERELQTFMQQHL